MEMSRVFGRRLQAMLLVRADTVVLLIQDDAFTTAGFAGSLQGMEGWLPAPMSMAAVFSQRH